MNDDMRRAQVGRHGENAPRRATGAGRRGVLRMLAGGAAAAALPARAAAPRPLLLRGARHVVTMAAGPQGRADILVRNGTVVAVDADLQPGDAEVVDLAGHILMPGFVDTHWHMWNSAARGLWRSAKGGFAPTMAAFAPFFSPADVRIGVELALAEAVDVGITTVHNWAHNVRSPAHAEAEIAAMTASGVRGRFAYGYPQDAGRDRPMDLAHLASLARRPPSDLVSLGICARGPDRSDAAVWQREWAAARHLGLPISTHIASDPKAAALHGIDALAGAGGLGADVQLVHLTAASRADMERAARGGSPVSISPWTELEVGYGVPPIADMVRAGLRIGLSVDNVVLAGSADPFAVMRLTGDLARGAARDSLVVDDESVLRWATLGGAGTLGLADRIGSIAVGRRADIIALRTESLHTTPAADVPSLVTHAMRPEDVRFVMIDGAIHKRDGRLTRVDPAPLRADAASSIGRLRARAGI